MERVVLVDDLGQPTGSAEKESVHHSHTPLHLAFSCYIFDEDGQLLLTQRAATKRTWPNVWTNSCCGHPAPGEPIADSIFRRAREELGMSIAEVTLVLPTFRYMAQMGGIVENELCPVFRATAVTPPRPNQHEVSSIRWMKWAHVRRLAVRRPPVLSPWCIQQVRQLDNLAASPPDWPMGAVGELPPAAISRGAAGTRAEAAPAHPSDT